MSVSVEHRHDLVVIGASAGGVEALQRVVAGFPPDLPASICVVLHRTGRTPSALAQVLDRAGPLPCRAAVDGDGLELGQILVAPPDRHLVIEAGHVRLTDPVTEPGHRPAAIDVLFRSAAATYDGRTIGVVLSGTLDDGSAGLAVIKAGGGGTVVQDPERAMYADMPRNAIAGSMVDAVAPLERVAEIIVAMVMGTDLLTAVGPVPTDGPQPAGSTAC
jgi:two-component system chemotaxis response regulator CheB